MPQVRVAARLMLPLLPSFADQFNTAVPLTRIRDIAHRNDMPHELKQEIKHKVRRGRPSRTHSRGYEWNRPLRARGLRLCCSEYERVQQAAGAEGMLRSRAVPLSSAHAVPPRYRGGRGGTAVRGQPSNRVRRAATGRALSAIVLTAGKLLCQAACD
jgi:hypothetical protein